MTTIPIPPEPPDGTTLTRTGPSGEVLACRDNETARDWPTAADRREWWYVHPGPPEPVDWPTALGLLLGTGTNAQATTTGQDDEDESDGTHPGCLAVCCYVPDEEAGQ